MFPYASSRSSPHRLTAQVLELKQQLAEAHATKTCTSPTPTLPPLPPPTAPPPPDIGATAALQTPGTTGQQSPAGFPHDHVAARGQGFIYVVDPSLQGEIERLKESVAERDRIIKSMEKLGRTRRKKVRERELSQSRTYARRRIAMGPRECTHVPSTRTWLAVLIVRPQLRRLNMFTPLFSLSCGGQVIFVWTSAEATMLPSPSKRPRNTQNARQGIVCPVGQKNSYRNRRIFLSFGVYRSLVRNANTRQGVKVIILESRPRAMTNRSLLLAKTTHTKRGISLKHCAPSDPPTYTTDRAGLTRQRKESSILPGRGRNTGQQPNSTDIARSSGLNPHPGDSVDHSSDCSSECSSSSTSLRLSITTPPRAGEKSLHTIRRATHVVKLFNNDMVYVSCARMFC